MLQSLLDRTVAQGTAPGIAATVVTPTATVSCRAGHASLEDHTSLTPDSLFCWYSVTKSLTLTCVLMLVDEGRLDLDVPAAQYEPRLAQFQVLTGFDADGEPVLEPIRTPITTRMLITHMAGMTYPFFSAHQLRYAAGRGRIETEDVTTDLPLIRQPGASEWSYGNGIDWAGRVVENIAGMRLGDFMARRIWNPLGMTSCTFDVLPQAASRLVVHYTRTKNGFKRNRFLPKTNPRTHMGGQGIFGTVDDMGRFVQMWLRGGTAPDGTRLLSERMVEYALENHLPAGTVMQRMETALPHIANTVELFPGVAKGHSLIGARLMEADPASGAGAGTVLWFGLANLMWWVDRKAGVGGFMATQVMPAGDEAIGAAFVEIMREAYTQGSGRGSSHGSSHGPGHGSKL